MKQEIQTLFDNALNNNQKKWDQLFLSAVVQEKRGVTVFQQKLNSVEIADTVKIGVLVGSQNRWGSASLEQASADNLDQAINQALAVSQFNDVDDNVQLAEPQQVEALHQPDAAIPQSSIKEFEQLALDLEQQAQNYAPVITNIPYVWVGYQTSARIIGNSNGVRVLEDNHLMQAALSASAKGQDGRTVNVSHSTHTAVKADFNGDELIKDVAGEASQRIEPVQITSGDWPIILDAPNAASLLGTFMSVFSGDALARQLTRLEGQLGKPIAAPIVNLAQSTSQGLTPHSYDAEGSLCQDLFLIKDGVFQNFLHNLYTAHKTNSQTTGNASEGYDASLGVVSTNIAWDGPTTKASDIISSQPKALLIKELHGASVSPISGDFSYGALGYQIENGQVTNPIADFTIAGNFFELLGNIQAIGDDITYLSPHILGSYGGRTLLVKSLSVAGK